MGQKNYLVPHQNTCRVFFVDPLIDLRHEQPAPARRRTFAADDAGGVDGEGDAREGAGAGTPPSPGEGVGANAVLHFQQAPIVVEYGALGVEIVSATRGGAGGGRKTWETLPMPASRNGGAVIARGDGAARSGRQSPHAAAARAPRSFAQLASATLDDCS